jgi:hypothetical protein
MRFPVAGATTLLVLAACAEPVVAPVNEVELAASLSVEATAAMGGDANGPASILRNLVRQVRAGDNAEALALLARADALAQQARESANRELATQAHGLVLQAVVMVFPNAAPRIGNAVRTGLERVRSALGSRHAPRIRRALDEIAGLLRRSAAAQSEGRPAVALDLVLRASEMLGRLVDHLGA